MNLVDGTKIERIEVAITLSDEYGIYFCGKDPKEQKKLAFPFSSAKSAISFGKKISEQFGMKYNIASKVQAAALAEKENEVTELEPNKERGETKMADTKREVNVKGLCRSLMDANATKEEIMAKIAAVYTAKGKDEKYAAGRAKAVYSDICKERGLTVKKEPKARKEAETTQEPVQATVDQTVVEDAAVDAEPTVVEDAGEDNTENAGDETEANEEVME